MPKPNRVSPDGRIVAVKSRGILMGNRGCLHNPSGEIVREFNLTRWITCLLEFRGRRRTVMSPGKYTELFFLDEATSLAAGHRPCGECRRSELRLFRNLWPQTDATLAQIDATLHRERRQVASAIAEVSTLPHGTMLISADRSQIILLSHGSKFLWSFDGYLPYEGRRTSWRILTPPSVIRVLAAGYPVGIHASGLCDPE